MSKYNSNLASEYFILASLYRLGLNAYVTLGNKKSVDIIVATSFGKQLTIDVKGIAGKTSFPVDNVHTSEKKNFHFIAFVSFLNKITEPDVYPEIYIVPHNKVQTLLYQNPKGTRTTVNLSRLRKEGSKYRDNWKPLQS